ncbi:amidohydrolase family protein [Pseudomonas sp. ITEM 17296]|uniref:metal-dependent hydrolase family protein n=1 Tax=Pseudomonas sp. ITEM 17296 TaxID=2790281 RepID=UPI0023804CD4|nr:amidohydrolase family protein [Pseudomonas sp. ITEM 17296]MDE4537440.1 amidohydrolase family protein [Pseudomonas sp. ITEM 17296]
MPRRHVHCQTLFTGLEDQARHDQVLIIEKGVFTHVGPRQTAPQPLPGERVIDTGGHFVMPGLVDVHTHLVFGNAKSEEDIDLHVSPEFRALRGLFFTQHVLAAGYTSVVVPGDAGHCSIAVRNAINAGMFTGPRIAASSNVIANRQSLNDWFPSWVGTPEYFSGRLCATRDEQIAEIRRQAKDGVDLIKIAMDGPHMRPNGEHIAAFTQDETRAMVEEIHRLGKKVAVHAYGREAVLYAAKVGVDVIFHGFFLDDACIEAILESGSHLAPTFTMLANNVEFAEDYEPSTRCGYAAMQRRVIEVGCRNLRRAREAGVPFMTGSDSGFAITPYGEWHAREIEIFVDWLGFSPAQALRAATSVAARMMPVSQQVGAIEVGRRADFICVDGSPLQNVSILQERERIRDVYLGGHRVEAQVPGYDPYKVSDFNTVKWAELHTRQRAMEMGKRSTPGSVPEQKVGRHE